MIEFNYPFAAGMLFLVHILGRTRKSQKTVYLRSFTLLFNLYF
jgi:hypothetical protein